MSAKHVRAREPDLTRKGFLGHPRTLMLAVVAMIFTAYVLGYLPRMDSLFSTAVDLSRSHGLLIVSPIVLLIVGLFALFVLMLFLGSLSNLITSISRRFTFFGRRHTPLEQFIRLAQDQGLSERVAKETYQMLKPYYPGRMCIALEDELRRQLILKDDNILFIQSKLLNRCDRREVLSFSVESIQTVYDLMLHTEGAPPQHVSGIALRRRKIDLKPRTSVDRRVVPSRRSSGIDQPGTEGAGVAATRRPITDRRNAPRRVDDRNPQDQSEQAKRHQQDGSAINSVGAAGDLTNTRAGRRETDAVASPPDETHDFERLSTGIPQPLRHEDDPDILRPRRREHSGVYRRQSDPTEPSTASVAAPTSSLDDPDLRPHTRHDHSAILRRAVDENSEVTSATGDKPESPQEPGLAARQRRIGETASQPRVPIIPPIGTSTESTTNDNVFVAPRKPTDTGFRRRSVDPLVITPDFEGGVED